MVIYISGYCMIDLFTNIGNFDFSWDKLLVILLTYVLALIFIRSSGPLSKRMIRLNRFTGGR